MADNEYQEIPTNNNLDWNFRKTDFIAEILEYDGHSEDVSLFWAEGDSYDYDKCGIVLIPAIYLPGLREHHYADRRIKCRITIERIDDEIIGK